MPDKQTADKPAMNYNERKIWISAYRAHLYRALRADDAAKLADEAIAKYRQVMGVAVAGFDDRETATILHGLRMIQNEGRFEGCSAGDCNHFEEVEALSNEEIDELAKRINGEQE